MVAEVASIDPENRTIAMSIRRLSDELGVNRDAITKALSACNVAPSGRRHGHPVYRLRDAAPALYGRAHIDTDGEFDPNGLPPQQRNQWFQSEARRVDIAMTTQQLLPAAQFEAELADMVKDFVAFLEALPDQLERDAALTPEQVQAMHERIDEVRERYHRTLIANEGGYPPEPSED